MAARIATGLVLAPLLVWLLLAAPLPAITAVIALAAWQSARELLAMFPDTRGEVATAAALAAGVIAAAPLAGPAAVLPCAAIAATLLLSLCLRRPDDLLRQSRVGALAVAAVAYVGAMAACLTAIAALPAPVGASGPFAFGPTALLGHFVLVFLGDTGAYFAGRLFGRRKLYPLVSPKKTVEGAIGGAALSVVGFAVFAAYLLPQLGVAEAAAGALVVAVVAQVGDLAESMFKRATDTKDSGALLPGHGGMLDRLDGVLFGAPWMLGWLLALHGSLS